MSKFKTLIFSTILNEAIDYDDPTERYWDRSSSSSDNIKPQIKKNTLYTKPINPVQDQDNVYIKCVTTNVNSPSLQAVMYLTGNKDKKYTYDKETAKKFPADKAEEFINKHDKTQFNSFGTTFERHFELEKI